MEHSGLLFTTSPWLTLLCVIIGGGYAWLLYHPQPVWNKTFNYLLAFARGLLVALICFLLLSPLVKTVRSTVEKAKVVLAIDNSSSLSKAGGDSLKDRLRQFHRELVSEGYEVSIHTLSGTVQNPDSIRFTHPTTNLSGMLSLVKSSFEGQNLSDVVLLSDGIFNQGASPAFGTFPFRVHTVAVGDTVPGRDIRIKNIAANRVAFLGNKFPVQADIIANGMAGQRASVSLKQGSKVLETRNITITGNHHFESVTFITSSGQKGIQHYTLEINGMKDEAVLHNNRREVYIDIIDGRQKILVLALAPHPDLKAIRSILSQNENYEPDIHVLSASPLPPEIPNNAYDLVILHQLPDIHGIGNSLVSSLAAKNTPLFFILGNQSAFNAFNPINHNLQLAPVANQFDQAAGRFNTSFQALNLDAEKLAILERLPPLSVPYGEYKLATGTETVLFQKLGNLNTSKPLLTIQTGGAKKTGVLLGEGLWRWRMEEFSLTEKTETVDNLFERIFQLLSIKEDKRKFRVYPSAPEFPEGEPVLFQTEVYNDVFEKTYGQEITLKISRESPERTETYTYVNTEDKPGFTLSGLEEGVYRYTAGTILKGQPETVSGQLLVRNPDLENLNTTADFGMLRELAARAGGQFVYPESLPDLARYLDSNRVPDRVDSTDELVELIHLKWLFFLLLAIAVLEWGTRKYLGGY